MSTPVLAIHGGAGTIARALMTPERASAHAAALRAVLAAGAAQLAAGASALDVVTAAVAALEDCPLFNAGHGAVLTAEGVHELDASIMCGARGAGGAVAGLTSTRNPVRAARALLEAHQAAGGGPLMLAGAAGDAAAAAAGLEQVPQSYFCTPHRVAQLAAARAAAAGAVRDHDGASAACASAPAAAAAADARMGTVGAVCLDSAGRLAAATSTGGMTCKRPGRVGDTPLLGAGTWADERVAVSCTGTGEAFILSCAAHEVAARVQHAGASVAAAAEAVVRRCVPARRGSGGLIAVGAGGDVALPYSTEGMYRGFVRAAAAGGAAPEAARVFIWESEITD